MSDDHHETKSDSSMEFQDLTTSKMSNYLKQVKHQIDSNPITFNDLLDENKSLGEKVDSMNKENIELKQKVSELDGVVGKLRQDLILSTEQIRTLQEQKMLLKSQIKSLEEEKAQLRTECAVTEDLWKQENSKYKALEEEKLQVVEENQKLKSDKLRAQEEHTKSNGEKIKIQSKIDQLIKQNNDLAEIVNKAYEKMHTQTQVKESQLAILQEKLNDRDTQVNQLKQRIQTLEKSLIQVPQEKLRKISEDEIDFVLSRGPSRATQDESFGGKINQSGRSVSCEPWIMKESNGNISDQQRSQQDAQLMEKMQQDLAKHIAKVAELSERLLERQEELEKTKEQLSKVQQSLQQQLQCARLTNQMVEIVEENHKKQVAFYSNQLTEFTEMHNSQLEAFEFHKKRSEELEKYLNYPVVMKAMIEKFEEEKRQWETKMNQVSGELEETKRKLNEQQPIRNRECSEVETKLQTTATETESSQLVPQSEESLTKTQSILKIQSLQNELLQAIKRIAQLQSQKSHLQISLQRTEQSFDEHLKELESLKRQLSSKMSILKSLQNQLKETYDLYEIEKNKSQSNEQLISQLTQCLEEEKNKNNQKDNSKISDKDIESELRDQFVAEINNAKNLQQKCTSIQGENEKLQEELKSLKNSYISIQQEKDSLEIQIHHLKSILTKAEQAFNQDMDKVQQKNLQLIEANAKLHNNCKQSMEERQKLRTEINEIKSMNLIKTKELNRKIASAQSEIVDLTEQLRIYEQPRSNKERFELLRKWFGSRDWKKEDKCDFMGWTEEFFRQYAKMYCECGEVEEIEMINWQYD